MYHFIIGFIVFLGVLLVLVILAQNAKGGGLTSQFGGSAASNIMGVKKTGDLLEKLTWGIVIVIMTLCLFTSTTFMRPDVQGPSNELLERAGEEAPLSNPGPAIDLPAAGGDSAR